MPSPEYTGVLIGVSLGALLGAVSGAVFLLLLHYARARGISVWQRLGLVVAKMLAVPTFWFGGPWATGILFAKMDWINVVPWYCASLALTFLLIVYKPLRRFIQWVTDAMQ